MVALLIRHGHASVPGKHPDGRRADLSLSTRGSRDVAAIVTALHWAPLAAVYSSPRARALETARPIAIDHELEAIVRPAFSDPVSQEATGQDEPLWRVSERVMQELHTLMGIHQGHVVAIVTHADPIRCALAALSGVSPEHADWLDVDPGHVSAVGMTMTLSTVLEVNLAPDDLFV
jgi:broad specificity phosphatase PhoE